MTTRLQPQILFLSMGWATGPTLSDWRAKKIMGYNYSLSLLLRIREVHDVRAEAMTQYRLPPLRKILENAFYG